MKKNALIIIDMLNDFMDGVLGNPLAKDIVPSLARLLAHARSSSDWVVVFSNDSHRPTDRELKIWGEHAMEGTSGAAVIDALRPAPREGKEWLSPKQYYGAFDGTGLGEQLRAQGVEKVYLTGQHTHCCVRHSAYGAFREGLEIAVVRQCVVAFEGVDNEEALEYLKTIYGAEIVNENQLYQTDHAIS